MKKTFNGKMKAVTFSFDDGVTQDRKLIEILNKYGLKGTFNLNSALLGTNGELSRNDHVVRHDNPPPTRSRKFIADTRSPYTRSSIPILRNFPTKELSGRWKRTVNCSNLSSVTT